MGFFTHVNAPLPTLPDVECMTPVGQRPNRALLLSTSNVGSGTRQRNTGTLEIGALLPATK